MYDLERFPTRFYFLFAIAADGIGIAIPQGGPKAVAYWNAAGQI
jgi:hypothetical protein